MYLAALPTHDARRQHLHDVAMISFLPETGQFPAYCSLIRLKWAGCVGSGNCDAEEEIIDWAIQALRTSDDDSVAHGIVSVLISWERDFDESIATALKSLCADCSNAGIRKAAMEALVAHSAMDNAALESSTPPGLQRFESAAFRKLETLPEGNRLDTRKIIIPRSETEPGAGTEKAEPAE